MSNTNKVRKGKWLVPATALVLGALVFGGNDIEASAAEYTPETWVVRSPEEITIVDRSNYLIIWGDTLWAISEASGVSVNALVQINNIANRDLIYAGNTLIIDGQVITVTEQNGKKSSFVVEGDNVKKTETHAVADQTVAPKEQVAAKPVVKEDESVEVVEEDEGGNFTIIDVTEEAKDAVTDTDENVVEDEVIVDEDEAVEEDEGGNFLPAVPVTPEVEEEVDVPVEEEVEVDVPVEEEVTEPELEENEPIEGTISVELQMSQVIDYVLSTVDDRLVVSTYGEIVADPDANLQFFGSTGEYGNFDDIDELYASTQVVSAYLTSLGIEHYVDNGSNFSNVMVTVK